MSIRIRQRMSGDRRRGDLSNLVRTRIGRRSAGLSNSPSWQPWTRMLHVVGPLADDGGVAGHDVAWTRIHNTESWISGVLYTPYGLRADFSLTTPDYIVPDSGWIRKMRPMRYRIGPDESLTYGGPGSEFVDEKQFLRNAGVLIPSRTLAPPDTGHFGTPRLGSVSIEPPFAIRSASLSRITHARLIVNGVDMSGIVELSSINAATQFRRDGFSLTFNALSLSTLSAISISDAIVEVDFWVHFEVRSLQLTGGYATGYDLDEYSWIFADDGTARDTIGADVGEPRFLFTATEGINVHSQNANLGSYLFAFDSPFVGLDEIETVTADGWTLTRPTHSFQLTNVTSQITLQYGGEIAVMLLRREISGTLYTCRYYCSSTAETYRLVSPGPRVAPFNPESANTFVLQGLITGSEIYPPSLPGLESLFAQFPNSITVSRS
jgi:hypothetical protein